MFDKLKQMLVNMVLDFFDPDHDYGGLDGLTSIEIGTDIHESEDFIATLNKVTDLKTKLPQFDELKYRGDAFCSEIRVATSAAVSTEDLLTTMNILAEQGYRLVSEVICHVHLQKLMKSKIILRNTYYFALMSFK